MSVVYMLHDTGRGLYRVGRTKSLRSRVLTHYKERQGDLRLIWYIVTNNPSALETHLHNEWKGQRICGEWFDLTPQQVSLFRSVTVVEYHDSYPLDDWERNPTLPNKNCGAKPRYLIRRGELVCPLSKGKK